METRTGIKLSSLKEQGKKALIPYIMAGVPSIDESLKLALKLADAGSDILEIGVPFSDPVADGPVIQKASEIALEQGINTDHVFELAQKIRSSSSIPLIFLVYYNCIFRYGIPKFIERCLSAGVDGLIVPDLPFEEKGELNGYIKGFPIDLITLAAQTSKERLSRILPEATGFVYCVSALGVTGERDGISCNLKQFLSDVARWAHIPRAVGFGISSCEQVRSIKSDCEGVIVGSSLMRRVMERGIDEGIGFIKQLRKALDGDG